MSRRRYVSDVTGVIRSIVIEHGKNQKKAVKKRRRKPQSKKGFSRNTIVGERRRS